MKNKHYFEPKNPEPVDMKKVWFVHVRFWDIDKEKYISKKFRSGINPIKYYPNG